MEETRVLSVFDLPPAAGLVFLAAGTVLLVFGTRWHRFTEVLSMAFLAGLATLILQPSLAAVNPVWPTLAACLAAGLLTARFPGVARSILAAVIVGVSLSVIVNLVAGWPGASYYVASLSTEHVNTVLRGPDYAGSQLMLGLLVGGVVLGTILALAWPEATRMVVMSLEGGLALVLGAALVGGRLFAAWLPPDYPHGFMRVGVLVWGELVILGVLVQRKVRREDRRRAPEAGQ